MTDSVERKKYRRNRREKFQWRTLIDSKRQTKNMQEYWFSFCYKLIETTIAAFWASLEQQSRPMWRKWRHISSSLRIGWIFYLRCAACCIWNNWVSFKKIKVASTTLMYWIMAYEYTSVVSTRSGFKHYFGPWRTSSNRERLYPCTGNRWWSDIAVPLTAIR
jgi:hypothetical protein